MASLFKQVYNLARLSIGYQVTSSTHDQGTYSSSKLDYLPSALALAGEGREFGGYDLGDIASFMGKVHGVKSKAQKEENWNDGQKRKKKGRKDLVQVHNNKYQDQSHAAQEQARILAGDTPEVRAQQERNHRELEEQRKSSITSIIKTWWN